MLTNKLTNMIFSNSHENGSSFLHEGVKKVLGGIKSCISTTEKINRFSLNPDNQEGLNCLIAMCNKIDNETKEIDSKLAFRKTFKR